MNITKTFSKLMASAIPHIYIKIPREGNWVYHHKTPGSFEYWGLSHDIMKWFDNHPQRPPYAWNSDHIIFCFYENDKERAMLFKLTFG